MKSRQPGAHQPVHSRVAAFPVSRLAGAVAALPLLAAGAAFAQAASEPASQDVVVSAARVEQRLPDTLPATTVISRADIEASPALDVPDLLRTFTSFNVTQSGPLGSQSSVFVRGANSNQVMVLVDGAPLSRADVGSAPWELVPLAQIDHIEVVRGNLSSLYGAQAVGGVVQIFTKHGAGSSVSLGGGSRGTILGSGSLGTRLGGDVTPLDISASVSGVHTDGYSARDPRTDSTANPDRDAGTQSGATFAVAKTWTPGQRTSFSVMHSDTSSDYDGYETPFQTDRLKTSLDALTLQSHHALGGGVNLDLNAGETVDHFTDPTGPLNFGPAAGTARTRVLGVGTDWTVVDGQNLQLGFENRNERYGDTDSATTVRRTNSIRAGWLGNFAEGLEVQANVRHDDANDYGVANTGLLALGWRVSPEWTLVAQGSTAFSAPSFSAIAYEAEPLKPERSRDLELGAHWQHAGWLARATVFSQRQHNLVGYNAEFQSVNIGHASNRGLELALDGDVGAYGKLGLDATFQDPRDDDAHAALLRRPRTVASANWRVPVAGWEAGVWLNYTGARTDYAPVTYDVVEAKPRTALGLSAARPLSPNWSIAVKVDNLTGNHTPEVLGYTPPPTTVLFSLRGQWQ